MTLIPTADLIAAAAARQTGIAALNVLHLETAEALVQAAQETGIPIILQVSENCVSFHGGLDPIALGCLALARASSAPLALHLDHAEDEALAKAAIDLGFGSVMFDGSNLDYDDNVAATRRVAEYAHAHGIAVEAELGRVGGKDGVHAPGVRTDPDEAVAFVAATGVDALAVAVGSSHAMTDRTAKLDLELIDRLRRAVPVPLVLHGSSGVPDDELAAAVRAGMTKINISTHLNRQFTGAVRDFLAANPSTVDSRKYLAAGRRALAAEAARLARLLDSAGLPADAETHD